jgi:hypothetical protein
MEIALPIAEPNVSLSALDQQYFILGEALVLRASGPMSLWSATRKLSSDSQRDVRRECLSMLLHPN